MLHGFAATNAKLDGALWNAFLTAAGRASQLKRALQTLEGMQVLILLSLWFLPWLYCHHHWKKIKTYYILASFNLAGSDYYSNTKLYSQVSIKESIQPNKQMLRSLLFGLRLLVHKQNLCSRRSRASGDHSCKRGVEHRWIDNCLTQIHETKAHQWMPLTLESCEMMHALR